MSSNFREQFFSYTVTESLESKKFFSKDFNTLSIILWLFITFTINPIGKLQKNLKKEETNQLYTYRYIPAFEGKHKESQYLNQFYTIIASSSTVRKYHLRSIGIEARRSTVYFAVGETTARSQPWRGAQEKLTWADSPPFHAATISVIAGDVAGSTRPILWVDVLLSLSARNLYRRSRRTIHWATSCLTLSHIPDVHSTRTNVQNLYGIL